MRRRAPGWIKPDCDDMPLGGQMLHQAHEGITLQRTGDGHGAQLSPAGASPSAVVDEFIAARRSSYESSGA